MKKIVEKWLLNKKNLSINKPKNRFNFIVFELTLSFRSQSEITPKIFYFYIE